LSIERGRLTGLFTDSDLARLFEHHREEALDEPIRGVMTSQPLTIQDGALMTEAVSLMAERKISELPVVDDRGHPEGLDRRDGCGRTVPPVGGQDGDGSN
jgi:arabinose-5-phosphate isomerase